MYDKNKGLVFHNKLYSDYHRVNRINNSMAVKKCNEISLYELLNNNK